MIYTHPESLYPVPKQLNSLCSLQLTKLLPETCLLSLAALPEVSITPSSTHPSLPVSGSEGCGHRQLCH